MKNFKDCINPDAVREKYLALVMAGGYDLVALNKELQLALRSMSGKTYTGKAEYTFYHNEKKEEGLTNAINQLVALKMDGVKLSLLGSWIWIEGDSKPYKEELKAMGCRFNGKRTKETGRGVWNWTTTVRKRRFNSKLSRSDLGVAYEEKSLA